MRRNHSKSYVIFHITALPNHSAKYDFCHDTIFNFSLQNLQLLRYHCFFVCLKLISLVYTCSVQVPLCLITTGWGVDKVLLRKGWLGIWFFWHRKKLLRCVRAHRLWLPTLWLDVRFLWIRKCHAEEGLRTAHKFVDITFASYFLHNSFLVVITKRTAQFVVVHGRTVFLNSPSTSYFFRVNEFELHATPRPSDKRGTFRLVQKSHKELPQLQWAPSLEGPGFWICDTVRNFKLRTYVLQKNGTFYTSILDFTVTLLVI